MMHGAYIPPRPQRWISVRMMRACVHGALMVVILSIPGAIREDYVWLSVCEYSVLMMNVGFNVAYGLNVGDVEVQVCVHVARLGTAVEHRKK